MVEWPNEKFVDSWNAHHRVFYYHMQSITKPALALLLLLSSAIFGSLFDILCLDQDESNCKYHLWAHNRNVYSLPNLLMNTNRYRSPFQLASSIQVWINVHVDSVDNFVLFIRLFKAIFYHPLHLAWLGSARLYIIADRV